MNKITNALFRSMLTATMVEEAEHCEGPVCDAIFLGAQNAAHEQKATELLGEMKEADKLAGKDTAWIDKKLEDLDEFVVDNLADLDKLLAKETPKVAKKKAHKCGHDDRRWR